MNQLTSQSMQTKDEVTQAFDNMVNVAWGGAKRSEAGKLSTRQCYELIDEINKELTKLKHILYTRSNEN